ncbi:hypothetical protein ACFTAO_35900 [Paenibacillus rhizoplanae]
MVAWRPNLFIKMVAILLSLIAATLLFYGMSYRKDVGVITSQIKTTDLNHLEFLTQQMDDNINQLAGSMYALQRDPTIRDYEQITQLGHLIDPAQTIMTVLEKLSLQTSSSTWENRIVLYKPFSGGDLGLGFLAVLRCLCPAQAAAGRLGVYLGGQGRRRGRLPAAFVGPLPRQQAGRARRSC